jgi:fumarate reductase subunit C
MEHQQVSLNKYYKKKMSILWWTRRISYIRFILRELTSLTVAFFAIVFLFLIRALSNGPEAYAAYLEALRSPVMIVLHIIAFAGLIFHSITWFNLAPKAMVIKVGKNRVPGTLIVLANYAGWIVISIVIAWLLL